MAVDLALHDLVVELRASDPDWQASISRFHQFRRQQAISYQRRYRDAGQTGQQRGCLCGATVHHAADGSKRDLDGGAHYCGEYLLA